MEEKCHPLIALIDRHFEAAIIIGSLILLLTFNCRGILTSSQPILNTLEKQGYQQIEIMEQKYFFVGMRGCSSNDAAQFVAKVTNSEGQEQLVTICTTLSGDITLVNPKCTL
jgi:hypothetical protein